MGVKPDAAGGFYREEAARLASEAARTLKPPSEQTAKAPPYVPPVLTAEPDRPLLRPQPASNQNAPLDHDDIERPKLTPARVIAWIVLLPWYVAIALASIGISALFIKGLLGL